MVLIENLHQVGQQQFALGIVGVEMLDIRAQCAFSEGDDAGVDLARFQQLLAREGVGAAVEVGFVRRCRVEAEDVFVFPDFNDLVVVGTGWLPGGVGGWHAHDAAIGVGLGRAAVQAGEYHHVAVGVFKAGAELGDDLPGQQAHIP